MDQLYEQRAIKLVPKGEENTIHPHWLLNQLCSFCFIGEAFQTNHMNNKPVYIEETLLLNEVINMYHRSNREHVQDIHRQN